MKGTNSNTDYNQRLLISNATNRISTTAFDFLGTNWSSTNSLAYLYTNSTTDYTVPQSAIVTSPSGFYPQGRVERILPLTNGAGHLTGAREVAFGVATFYPASSNLLVNVRVAEHSTPASGSPGTLPVTSGTIYLTGEFNQPGGTVTTLGPSAIPYSSTNGLAQQYVSLPGLTGFCRLRAWLTNTYDTNHDVWASLDQGIPPLTQQSLC